MTKIVLSTNGIPMSELQDLQYSQATHSITFRYKSKKYTVAIEEVAGTYVKVLEDGEMEFIHHSAKCHNS